MQGSGINFTASRSMDDYGIYSRGYSAVVWEFRAVVL